MKNPTEEIIIVLEHGQDVGKCITQHLKKVGLPVQSVSLFIGRISKIYPVLQNPLEKFIKQAYEDLVLILYSLYYINDKKLKVVMII